jgi:hypothetical protein
MTSVHMAGLLVLDAPKRKCRIDQVRLDSVQRLYIFMIPFFFAVMSLRLDVLFSCVSSSLRRPGDM